MSGKVLLTMEEVSKTFPGVKALSDVNFTLRKGEVHALMGENGAGKSTLIKVLTGVHPMDKGKVQLNGRVITARSPLEAQSLGISTVYQEINLCTNLSVAENLYIGRVPKRRGSIDWKKMHADSEQLLKRLNLNLDVKNL